MGDVYCYSFVEDPPSREVAIRLVDYRNQLSPRRLCFVPGFPSVLHGAGNLRKRCPKLLDMARPEAPVFCITDLDSRTCAGALIAEWFGQPKRATFPPSGLVFRVAVREIEAWVVADRQAWASYIGIAATNFPPRPEEVPDPKQALLNVIRSKGKKKLHTEMLPRGVANVGPGYNEVLCEFISSKWSPQRAQENSPSLRRAIEALSRL